MSEYNPIAAAQHHLSEMDNKPSIYDFDCAYCSLGFDKGHGGVVEQDDRPERERPKFCDPCLLESKHIIHYRHWEQVEDKNLYKLTIKKI